MTRKDYNAIAKVIRSANDGIKSKQLDSPIIYIVENLADIFKNDNPLFDYRKFHKACGTAD